MSQTKLAEQSLPLVMEPTGDGSQTEPWSVSRVEPKDFPLVWLSLSHQFRRGMKRGHGETISERGFYNAVASGEMMLWAIHRGEEILGGIFLQVEIRPRGKALLVLNVVAGRGTDFGSYTAGILQRLREFGDMIGAYTIESVSRLGAARILMRHGCKPKAMVMELRDGNRTA